MSEIAVGGELYDNEVQMTMKTLGIPMPVNEPSPSGKRIQIYPSDTPKSSEVTDPTTPSRMPLGSPTEPAGAFNSSAGTGVAPPDLTPPEPSKELPDINDIEHHDWVEGMFKSAWDAFKAPGDAMAGRFDPNSEEGVRRAMDMAGWMVGAPAPVASKLADGTLGSFAGVKSKYVMKEKLADLGHAQVLEGNGVHPDTVFNKTGWFRGIDGRWRYEIDDSTAKIDPKWVEKTPALEELVPKDPFEQVPFNPDVGMKVTNLGNVLKHPELYKAYPFLKDMPVKYDPKLTWAGAFFDPRDHSITMGPHYAQNKGVFLHEVQHAIQEHEGFARGGPYYTVGKEYELKHNLSKEPELNKEYIDLYDKIIERQGDPSVIITKKEIDRFKELNKLHQTNTKYIDAANKQAASYYTRLAGEVEARNVEARSEYGPRMRREFPIGLSQDVPNSLQISRNVTTPTSAYGYFDYERQGWVNPDNGKFTPWDETLPLSTPAASAPHPIRSAALRVNGKIYEGGSHFEALEKAEAEHNGSITVTNPDTGKQVMPKDYQEGFVTREGKFVDRVEAAKLVDKKDLIENYLKTLGVNYELLSEEVPHLQEAGDAYMKQRVQAIHNEPLKAGDFGVPLKAGTLADDIAFMKDIDPKWYENFRKATEDVEDRRDETEKESLGSHSSLSRAFRDFKDKALEIWNRDSLEHSDLAKSLGSEDVVKAAVKAKLSDYEVRKQYEETLKELREKEEQLKEKLKQYQDELKAEIAKSKPKISVKKKK